MAKFFRAIYSAIALLWTDLKRTDSIDVARAESSAIIFFKVGAWIRTMVAPPAPARRLDLGTKDAS